MGDDATRAATSAALDLLARQAYTTAQVRDKLRRRGHADGAIDAAVARLTELRILDDDQVAAAFIRHRSRERGRIGLRYELTRRGIDPDTADRALTDVDPSRELAAARALLERNAWRFAGARGLQRAAGFLARRGFASEVVRAALDERWGDAAMEHAEP